MHTHTVTLDMRAHVHAHIHTHTHTHPDIHREACIHAHTQTHTHTCMQTNSKLSTNYNYHGIYLSQYYRLLQISPMCMIIVTGFWETEIQCFSVWICNRILENLPFTHMRQ